MTLIDVKNFILRCYPNQASKKSRLAENTGRNSGLLLGPQSLKGVTVVQLRQYIMVFNEFSFKIPLKT